MNVIDQYLSEAIGVDRFYRIDQTKFKRMIPRIPSNIFTKMGYENDTIARVSFAPTIDHCILAIGDNVIDNSSRRYYVHEPINYKSLKIIDNTIIQRKRYTPDANINKEIWVTTPVNLKIIGEIEILKRTNKSFPIKINGKEFAKQYVWTWKWIKK